MRSTPSFILLLLLFNVQTSIVQVAYREWRLSALASSRHFCLYLLLPSHNLHKAQMLFCLLVNESYGRYHGTCCSPRAPSGMVALDYTSLLQLTHPWPPPPWYRTVGDYIVVSIKRRLILSPTWSPNKASCSSLTSAGGFEDWLVPLSDSFPTLHEPALAPASHHRRMSLSFILHLLHTRSF